MCNTVNEVIEILINRGITVATAESCTGGMVGKTITDFSGVSSVYLEGVITYANEAKIRLGVLGETLKSHGAVSRETAKEMAECVRKRAGAFVGISTTGVAGPGGGSREKPVGLVYMGISTEKETKTYALRLFGDRDTIRRKTTKLVFDKLLEDFLNGED
ncbi:MAG: nicotinamide-nucleotide amidohydrolase family protein [Clostridia bacterium]|nr:nicotinamide-nucleotide amidohydrolase family protein [Clostridia bacterium]